MKHSRVTAASFTAVLNPLAGLKPLAVLRPLAVLGPLVGIAASLAGALPARGAEVPFTDRAISTTALHARSVFATDLDGDGDMDVLSASLADDKIAWYENMSRPIPAVSHWGLVLTALLLLVTGSLLAARRKATAA